MERIDPVGRNGVFHRRLDPPDGKLQVNLSLAVAIALLVEFSRLYHAPWIDEFRRTTAGLLLLGRLFSPLNILAYLVGIATGALIEARWLRRR